MDPAQQGHGYGGSAIDLIVEEAKRSGSVSVTLSSVTLVSREDGSVIPLGDLIPDSHFVLTAG